MSSRGERCRRRRPRSCRSAPVRLRLGEQHPAQRSTPPRRGAERRCVAGPSAAAAEPVTVDWWHITTGDPGKADFQAIADAYTAAHPNVTIKITVLENEAFKTKLADDGRPACTRTCSSPGAAGPWPPAGRRRPAQGHHRRRRVLEGHDQPGRDEHLPVQRQAVRRSRGTWA